MKTINALLVESVQDSDLTLAMEALIDLSILEDSRITLESYIQRYETANGNIVDILNVEHDYKAWLADNGLGTIPQKATGETVRLDIEKTLSALANPSMESNLAQQLKRSYNNVMLNLKTLGKTLFDIKTRLRAKSASIEASPVLINSVEVYRFLTKDNAPVKNLVTSVDTDIKFIQACEKHYRHLHDLSVDMSKQFLAACKSKSMEEVRACIDRFDESLIDRQSFEDLTKFQLLGNRVVEIDNKGYPRFASHKGLDITFSTKVEAPDSLYNKIADGSVHGFSVGGPQKATLPVSGFEGVKGTAKVNEQLKKTGGEISMPDFLKMLDRAQTMNQDSIRFAQMAAQMIERVARMGDDLQDGFEATIDEETGKFDKSLFRDLHDLYKSARRSASQYMFLGKLLATMMEDHSTFVYRGVTNMANTVLKKAKAS